MNDRDIYTPTEFEGEVKAGSLIDYDGFGAVLDVDKREIKPTVNVYPSQWWMMDWPDGGVYVEWFNR